MSSRSITREGSTANPPSANEHVSDATPHRIASRHSPAACATVAPASWRREPSLLSLRSSAATEHARRHALSKSKSSSSTAASPGCAALSNMS